MSVHFENLYQEFLEQLRALSGKYHVGQIQKYSYSVRSETPAGDFFDLSIFAIVHGNEIGSLQAVNLLLKELNQKPAVPLNISLSLGNIAAARADKRYIERDLNRCFGVTRPEILEEQIAFSLQDIILRSRYVLDLHQTISETASDFFIFPMTEKNVAWAAEISPSTPIVVHGHDFSLDGLCLDLYATMEGKTAITYEMGPIGLIEKDVLKTRDLLWAALRYSRHGHPERRSQRVLYTWAQVLYSEPGLELVEGLRNFAFVRRGQVLGRRDLGGKIENVLAAKDGYILFPKYGEMAKASSELCRVVSELGEDERQRIMVPSKKEILSRRSEEIPATL